MLLHRFGDTSCLVFIDHCATQLHPRSLLYMFMHYNRTVPSPLYGFRVSYFVASAADGFSFLSKVSPALILTLLIITTKHISPINRWDIQCCYASSLQHKCIIYNAALAPHSTCNYNLSADILDFWIRVVCLEYKLQAEVVARWINFSASCQSSDGGRIS